MKKKIKKWDISGIFFIIILGSILHFTYEWSGNNPFIGIIGAVNESTWEHLKLLFWPALFFSILEYFYIGKGYNNFITAKVISIFTGMFLIIIFFYTYTGIVGDNYVVIDIIIFLISVLFSQYIGYRIITANFYLSKKTNIVALIAITVLMILFISFTFNPPLIPLFEDPKTGDYGM